MHQLKKYLLLQLVRSYRFSLNLPPIGLQRSQDFPLTEFSMATLGRVFKTTGAASSEADASNLILFSIHLLLGLWRAVTRCGIMKHFTISKTSTKVMRASIIIMISKYYSSNKYMDSTGQHIADHGCILVSLLLLLAFIARTKYKTIYIGMT